MKTVRILLMNLFFVSIFFGGMQTVKAQKRMEQVSENEKGNGEDQLVEDSSKNKKKKKKKVLKAPEPIGYPLHDQYSEQVWDYLNQTKKLTKLVEFIKVDLKETNDDEGEVTTELIVTNGLGEDLTWENALKQLKSIKSEIETQQKKGDQLKVLSNKVSNEKVSFKKMGKALKQTKNNLKIQALATAELGKTLYALGKNIATIIKAKKMTKKL